MYLKRIILLVVTFVILAPDITSGFEIISTTTERGNKDERCQQEIIRTLGNNLREQQNFWISFYNSSRESQIQKKIVQFFDKRLEEANAEFVKKQKDLIEILNKQSDLLQKFDRKMEEALSELKSYELQSQKQMEQTRNKIAQLEEVNAEFGKKQKELIEMVNVKQNDLLQHFDKRLEEMEAKFASKQEEVFKQFKVEIGKTTSHFGKVENVRTTLPKNCLEVLKGGNTTSGVYTILPKSDSPSFEVRCDMDTRDGGWTYVLNRFDGSQEFYLDWQEYKNGFGNLSGEFWLGLQHLYELTGFQDNHLLIELVDWDNKHYHAMYNVFKIGNEEEGYPLRVLDGYSGNAGDSLTYHKNMKFSTRDRDQDGTPGSCAVDYHGAWWYNACYYSNLAGTYFNTAKEDSDGMVWFHMKNNHLSLKKAKMMVRPLVRP